MNRLKAISLHQPYATAMSLGLKRNETRNRGTAVRGEIAICAARKQVCYSQALRALADHVPGFHTADLPYGRVVCVLEFVGSLQIDCCYAVEAKVSREHPNVIAGYVVGPFVPGSAAPSAECITIGLAEYALGDYTVGRYAWLTANVRPLKEPVPVKGYQGFFYLPADVEQKVRAQLA